MYATSMMKCVAITFSVQILSMLHSYLFLILLKLEYTALLMRSLLLKLGVLTKITNLWSVVVNFSCYTVQTDDRVIHEHFARHFGSFVTVPDLFSLSLSLYIMNMGVTPAPASPQS